MRRRDRCSASPRRAGGVALVARDGGTEPAVPFHGEHQAGIVTPAQDRLHFAAFDVTTEDRAELVALLERWTAAAAAMTAGRPVGDGEDDAVQRPAARHRRGRRAVRRPGSR